MTDPQDALTRLDAYRAAREADPFNPDALAVAEAAIVRAAQARPRNTGRIAIRDKLAPLLAAENPTLQDAEAAENTALVEMMRTDRRAPAAVLAGADTPLTLPQPMTAVDAARLPRPPRLLSVSGVDGAVLSVGEICLLAGAGGVGKSALAGEIALAVADPGSPNEHRQRSAGGLLDIHGGSGPVLWLAYEEAPGEIGARLAALATATTRPKAPAAVHILDMRGWPLYGPGERHGASGLYSARPEPLAGWQAMTDATAAIKPRLIIVDPMLAAYVGEGNAVAPVREFLAALAGLARERNAGVLALAHSTKAARGSKKNAPDPFDPGQIAGSAAWHDGVRGALVLDYEDDPQAGPQRRLAVTKANMGPARILRPAIPRRKGAGSEWIIGFQAAPNGGEQPGGEDTTDGSGLPW
ncbi:MAG: AAA family ATPase [Chloroflexi bacterium]|nr:AAA family ATPase [Chloroflexota bacterium]